MSSMRNAVQRRNHRERAQPKEREKWGILEKHKDYRLRARDFNAKKARLKHLRQKAADRNPDEFYYGMVNAKMSAKDGMKLGDRGNKSLSIDVARLLKTQDAGYLRIIAQKAKKEVEMLEQEIHVAGQLSGFQTRKNDNGGPGSDGRGRATIGSNLGKHTIFVDSRDAAIAFKPEEFFQTSKEGLHKRYNRPRLPPAQSQPEDSMDTKEPSTAPNQNLNHAKSQASSKDIKALEKWKSKLEACRSRLKQLERAEHELSMQRARMAKTPTVGGVDRWGRKWKVRERKR